MSVVIGVENAWNCTWLSEGLKRGKQIANFTVVKHIKKEQSLKNVHGVSWNTVFTFFVLCLWAIMIH